jgi:hypothetical protein
VPGLSGCSAFSDAPPDHSPSEDSPPLPVRYPAKHGSSLPVSSSPLRFTATAAAQVDAGADTVSVTTHRRVGFNRCVDDVPAEFVPRSLRNGTIARCELKLNLEFGCSSMCMVVRTDPATVNLTGGRPSYSSTAGRGATTRCLNQSPCR